MFNLTFFTIILFHFQKFRASLSNQNESQLDSINPRAMKFKTGLSKNFRRQLSKIRDDESKQNGEAFNFPFSGADSINETEEMNPLAKSLGKYGRNLYKKSVSYDMNLKDYSSADSKIYQKDFIPSRTVRDLYSQKSISNFSDKHSTCAYCSRNKSQNNTNTKTNEYDDDSASFELDFSGSIQQSKRSLDQAKIELERLNEYPEANNDSNYNGNEIYQKLMKNKNFLKNKSKQSSIKDDLDDSNKYKESFTMPQYVPIYQDSDGSEETYNGEEELVDLIDLSKSCDMELYESSTEISMDLPSNIDNSSPNEDIIASFIIVDDVDDIYQPRYTFYQEARGYAMI